MQLPLGNFFEVTVDSQRLSAWLDDTQRQLRTQSDRTDELARTVSGLGASLGARMKRGEEAVEEQLERMRRTVQEESNYLRLFLKDADKKTFEKIGEFENSLVLLNNRITITRDALQDDIALRLSFLEKKLTNPPPSADEQELKAQLQALTESTTALQKTLNERLQILEEGRAKGEDETAEMRRVQSHRSIATRSPYFSHSRKQLKQHRNATLYESQDDIDQIVNKISQLENRIQQERDQNLLLSNNRIVKISEKLTSVARLPAGDAPPPSDIVTIVTARLSKLEDTVVGRITECERGLGRLSNRSEITDEQIGIVARKFEKERTRMSEVMASFKMLEERKGDDRAIEQLRTTIKKLGKELEEGLQSKASCEAVERDRKAILDRIQAMGEALGQKAEKAEVKRGLTFLEEKLKEVIIVLAEEKSYNKDSAVKKGAFKCLSCDKELEGSPPEPSLPPRLPRDSTASARCSTSNIRKRIRLVNNSINEDY